LPYYECVFIARQDISAPQVDTLADHFTKVVEDLGGSIGKREYWGLRTLSYRIRKNRKGHYVLFNIDAPPAAIEEIGRQMRINEDIIRHLTVRVDALNPGPSQVMLSRSSRGDERDRDRPRRDDRGDRGERTRDRDDRGARERDDRSRGDRARAPGDEGGREGGDEASPAARESKGEP
jgi:small subunit ribosomal protein S6